MGKDRTFKLCITMAGAVSAGAYTAGVFDYLIETLDLWEQAKARNRELGEDDPRYDHSIPMHTVEIDVLSGSSAGGICGSLAFMALSDKNFQSYNKDNPTGKNNVFYQSWVDMGDTSGRSTIDNMLDNSDLKEFKEVRSLLNTKIIDNIADNAMKIRENREVPKYASDSLDLILTITNLRGIKFKVNFEGGGEGSSGGSTITNHGGFLRYKMKTAGYGEGIPSETKDLYYVLDVSKERDLQYLKQSTLGTAAFPIGLRSRELVVSSEYIKRYPEYLFGKDSGITPELPPGNLYRFNSVDGGVINNEPYGIGLKVLREKNPNCEENDNYAVIMIDPFPNKDPIDTEEEPETKKDIASIASSLFSALRNQVMFNQDGILDAIAMKDRTKFMIEPVRKVEKNGEWVRADNDLAAAPMAGFAGFLNRDFREHDFQLGRKNCQSFLRYYFAVESKDAERRLDLTPTDAMRFRFEFAVPPRDPNGLKLFPIIPDMRVLRNFDGQVNSPTYGKDANLEDVPYPKMSFADFEKRYKSKIKDRIGTLVKYTVEKKFLALLVNLFFAKNKGYKFVAETIKKELGDKGLLS